MPKTKIDSKQLEQARQQHIGRYLHNAARAFNTRALRKLHERGHGKLSLAHTNLLPYLDVEGTRATLLAKRAGITKQAAGQLVIELEVHGYVERQPDPDDARAVLVRFTTSGWQFLLDAQAIKQEIELEYREFLGEQTWQALSAALRHLVDLETQYQSQTLINESFKHPNSSFKT